MRAVMIEKLGGPEVLTVAERPAPEPGPGQAVVRVAAAGVNFMDIYTREGVGGYKPAQFPVVLGGEGAGTVTAVAGDVSGLSVGDRVAWAGAPGGYAEEVAVPADRLVPVPGEVDLDVAAAVMLQGMTAHYLCHSTYPVREGDVVVVHAAAGGVGLLLTQMVKRRGGIVVATTSGGEKAELARGAGPTMSSGTTCSGPPWPGSAAARARTSYTTASARRPSTTASPRSAVAARWCSTAPPAARSRRSTRSG